METRITHSLIKAVSGEFDLENISKLSLCRMSEYPSHNMAQPQPHPETRKSKSLYNT